MNLIAVVGQRYVKSVVKDILLNATTRKEKVTIEEGSSWHRIRL